jgi:hypothetical protein
MDNTSIRMLEMLELHNNFIKGHTEIIDAVIKGNKRSLEYSIGKFKEISKES